MHADTHWSTMKRGHIAAVVAEASHPAPGLAVTADPAAPAARPRAGVAPLAARLWVRGRLTKQVAECLADLLRARGVGVVLEAEHSCMTVRGVRAHGAKTVT